MKWGEGEGLGKPTENPRRAIHVPNTRHAFSTSTRYRGIALVWVAIFGGILIGIVGLSLDWGKVTLNGHQLQNAADAAALAGAQFVKFDHEAARRQAIAVGGCNSADNVSVTLRDNPAYDTQLDVVVGYWYSQTRTFKPAVDMNSPANAVKVVARRTTAVADGPVPLVFGPAFGTNSVNLECEAIAWSVGTTGAGLIALYDGDTEFGLQLGSNAAIHVNHGDVQVNSASLTAADAIGKSFNTDADEFNVCGYVDPPDVWTDMATLNDFSINQGPLVPPIGDPLALLPAPNVAGMPVRTFTGQAVLNPGYYPDGIRITSGSYTLNPGIYAVGGGGKAGKAGLVMTGGTVSATGVMFYITKSPSGIDAKLDLDGNPNLTLTPPDSGTYDGISIFQDRLNTRESQITGRSNFDLQGTLYFPSNLVTMGGTGFVAGNQIIAWRVDITGNSDISINYDGRNLIKGYRSILVK